MDDRGKEILLENYIGHAFHKYIFKSILLNNAQVLHLYKNK